MSSPDHSKLLPLMCLPDLILQNILLHLDLRSLKLIRLVCRRLKSLIESDSISNKLLPKFRIIIFRMKRISELISSSVPWNNFYINLDIRSSNKTTITSKIEKLATKYNLKLLEVQCDYCTPEKSDSSPSILNSNCNCDSVLLPFLTLSSDLLQTCYLKCSTISKISDPDVLKPAKISRISKVSKVFKNLSIRESKMDLLDSSTATELPEFTKLKNLILILNTLSSQENFDQNFLIFLKSCPNLLRLYLLFPSQDSTPNPISTTTLDTEIINPLTEYLSHRHSLGRPPLKLIFLSNSKSSKKPIPLVSSSLLKLVNCPQNTTNASSYPGRLVNLENVPATALPNFVDIQNQHHLLVQDILKILNSSINSITHVIHTATGFRNSDNLTSKYIPSGSKFSLIIHLTPTTTTQPPLGHQQCQQCPFLSLPDQLHSITLYIENTRASLLQSDYFDMEERESLTMKNLDALFRSRSELKVLKILTTVDDKLELAVCIQDFHPYFSKLDFALKGFPNLTKLHLAMWGRKDQDFWMLYEAVPLLEELKLVKCYRLRDEGVLGPQCGTGSMLQLNYLRHLYLKGYWAITDKSFIKVFSQMRLRSLVVWDDPDDDQESISIKSLEAIRNSTCGETIEYLGLNKPFKATLPEVKRVLWGCRSLRKFEIREPFCAKNKVSNHTNNVLSVHYM